MVPGEAYIKDTTSCLDKYGFTVGASELETWPRKRPASGVIVVSPRQYGILLDRLARTQMHSEVVWTWLAEYGWDAKSFLFITTKIQVDWSTT